MQKARGGKTTIAALSAIGLIVALGGCSSENGAASDSISVLFPQQHAGASEIWAAEFEAETGTTVEVTLVPYDELQQKATLDVQSGAAEFDVFDSWYPAIGALAAGNIIVPIDDVAAEAEPEDFIAAIYDPYSLVDGKRYGLPVDGDTQVLFYNEEILERNGISPPRTWDEYNAAVRTITENESSNGVYGAAVMGQQVPIILGGSYANRLAGFGGSFLDDTGAPTLDTPEAIGAARALQDEVEWAMPTVLETDFDRALNAFLGAQVGFMEFWTDLGTFSQDPEQSEIIDAWGVQQLPIGGSASQSLAALNAGFTMTLSSESKNPEAAKAFIAFAASREINEQLITTVGTGIDPNRRSTLESDAYRDFNAQVQEAARGSLSGALAWPTIPESPELFQTLTDSIADMIVNGQDPETTMRQVQAEWERILDETDR